MSIQGSKLVAPIGLQEVYSLLGVAKTGTYYDVATICSSEKINPDARFKPERVDTPMEVNEAQRKSNNFGWNVPSFQMGSLPGNASNEKGMWKWEYLIPRPGTDWCRLTDFVGYNHAATSHIRGLYVGNGKGHKPVVVPDEYLQQVPEKQYWAELQLDNGAEIQLDELMTAQGNVMNMYLTLVVALNRNGQGAVLDKSLWGQSEQTIGEAVTQNLGSIMAEVNTARMLADGIVSDTDGFRQTICAAFLAPKMTDGSWPYGVSLKKGSLIPVYYNDDYAVYGDGGEGGDLPALTVEVTTPINGDSMRNIWRLQENNGAVTFYGQPTQIGIRHERASYDGYLYLEFTLYDASGNPFPSWTDATFTIHAGDTRTTAQTITIPSNGEKDNVTSGVTRFETYNMKVEVKGSPTIHVTGNKEITVPMTIY